MTTTVCDFFHDEHALVGVYCEQCGQRVATWRQFDGCTDCSAAPAGRWSAGGCQCDGHAPLPTPGGRKLTAHIDRARRDGRQVKLRRAPTRA